jgi:hypothetical protein
MAFYRKNIGRAHQAARILAGLAAAVAASSLLPGLPAWLVAVSGLTFAATGLVGWCPMCAAVGMQGRSR